MGLFALDDDDKMHDDNVKLQCDDVVVHWIRRQTQMEIYFVITNLICHRRLVRTSPKSLAACHKYEKNKLLSLNSGVGGLAERRFKFTESLRKV